ncbi:MAG: NINE protein [Maricaulaceae bacterium]|jgi:TM2 domain-containing membrane protein YozV
MDRTEFYHVFFHALDSLPADRRSEFEAMVLTRIKNPTIIFGASCWLGWLGLDRFLLGQVLAGILKLITLGGLGIWWIVDLFLVSGSARRINAGIVRSAHATLVGGPVGGLL